MTAPADTLVERLDHLADVHSDNHQMTAGMVREAAARIRQLEAQVAARGEVSEARIREITDQHAEGFYSIPIARAIEAAIRQALGESKP